MAQTALQKYPETKQEWERTSWGISDNHMQARLQSSANTCLQPRLSKLWGCTKQEGTMGKTRPSRHAPKMLFLCTLPERALNLTLLYMDNRFVTNFHLCALLPFLSLGRSCFCLVASAPEDQIACEVLPPSGNGWPPQLAGGNGVPDLGQGCNCSRSGFHPPTARQM